MKYIIKGWSDTSDGILTYETVENIREIIDVYKDKVLEDEAAVREAISTITKEMERDTRVDAPVARPGNDHNINIQIPGEDVYNVATIFVKPVLDMYQICHNLYGSLHESVFTRKPQLFEAIFREASANTLANAFAKKFASYDGTDKGGEEIINFIAKNIGTVNGTGTNGITDDIKSNLNSDLSPVNKAIAFAVIRSGNPQQARSILKRYATMLNDSVDLDAVDAAIQLVNQNQQMSLSAAQQAVSK